MRLTFLLFLTLLAVPHAALAAEADPLHLAGSRVRLLNLTWARGRQVGTVVEVRGDTLLFTGAGGGIILVPAASLTRLEVSRGTRSHLLAGAGIGLLAGAVVGGVIGTVLEESSPAPVGEDYYSGLGAAAGAVIIGVVGAVVGAVVGSRQTERWERLRLPMSIGLLPSTDAIGLSVKVALR